MKKSIVFCTSNDLKFAIAQEVCSRYGVELYVQKINIEEVQSEDSKHIVSRKSQAAFTEIAQPVIVSDDSWAFVGLNGFPGPYMHSVDTWFTPDDFLRLTLPLENRQVILTQLLAYKDEKLEKIFANELRGTLLKDLKGTSKNPCHQIISMDSDNGLSIAEKYSSGLDGATHEYSSAWHEFAKWYAGA